MDSPQEMENTNKNTTYLYIFIEKNSTSQDQEEIDSLNTAITKILKKRLNKERPTTR
jgi:hypothetical protein